MATIIESLALSGSRKADGTVNAGGRVFLTRPGTASVAVTGWSDRDKTSAITLDGGGYLLDAAGKVAIFIDEPCNVRIEDSLGVGVDAFTVEPSTSAGLVEVMQAGWTGANPVTGQYTADGTGRTKLNTVLASLYASLGGVDGGFLGAHGTDTVALRDVIESLGFSPQMFGAVGNGTTDDTSALLAFAAAIATTGYPGILPSGTYKTSAVIAFGNDVTIRGAGSRSVIAPSNGTQGGVTFGTGAVLQNFYVTHATTSTGVGVLVGNNSTIDGVIVSGYGVTGATFKLTSGIAYIDRYSTASTVLDGVFVVGERSQNSAVSGPPLATVRSYDYTFTAAAQGPRLHEYVTADLANGGTTGALTDYPGAVIWHFRIRATSAGGGTIGTPLVGTAAYHAQFAIYECYNNSGGAFTFTFPAQFKIASNPAPANGSRVTVAFGHNRTESVWTEIGRATTT